MRAYATIVVGLVALVGYFMLPDGAHSWAYDAFGLVCGGALLYRAYVSERGRVAWALFGVGVLMWVAADITISVLTAANDGVEPFPSVADIFYLGAYPMIAAAIVLAGRLRGQAGGLSASVEGLIVTLAAAVPLWIFVIWPVLSDTSAGVPTAVVGASYPLMDLLLLGVAVRLSFAGRGRSPAVALLLAAGLITTLGADVIYNLQTLAGTYVSASWVDAGWLLGYVLWAAAALHPSAVTFLDPVRGDLEVSARKRTAAVLVVAFLLLATVAVSYIRGTDVETPLVLGALGVITLLVGLRLRLLAQAGSSGQWRSTALLFAGVVVAVLMSVGLSAVRAASERHLQMARDLLGTDPDAAATELTEAAAGGQTARILTVVMLALAAVLLGVLSVRFARARRSYEREQGFRALISGSADVITVIGPDTTVLAYPESVERALGLPEGSVLGTLLDTYLRPEDVGTTHAVLAGLVDHPGEARSLEWCLSRADGTPMDVEVSVINHLHDPRLGGFVLNVRDVSERKRLEAALQHQAFHDHLTGLANRALLEDRLAAAMNRTARDPAVQALLYLDLDDFKAVNDSLGHPVGDSLLIEVARRLQMGLRSTDTLARMGGDEFAVLLEGLASVEEASTTARRLLRALHEPIALPGGEFVVGASIGMVCSDGSGTGTAAEQAARLLRNADLAMYEAKRLGGGQIEVFAPEMHDAVSKRLQLKSELHRALDNGEFIVHYQPIVELGGGRTVGCEALARWNHPERGLVGPGAFIDAAEQTGLIVELGWQVLRAACIEAVHWPEALYVSVNVAGAQLARDEFIDEVRDALHASGLPASRLVLEVTETALIQDSDGNERRMSALRELGVSLAIDDFGTGYSSLNYLRRFPMDVLKIDKSFIDRVAVPGREQALVEAMISMGNSLDLNVVAEGIEEAGQATELAGRSCAYGQGYLFARPMPPDSLEEYLASAECSSSTA